MRQFWSWLGLNLGKRAGTVAVVGVLLTIGLGYGMVRLKFVTSNSSYLDANNVAQVDSLKYEKVFGGDLMATTFTMKPGTTIDNLFTPQNMVEMRSVEDRLARDPSVFDVVSPLDALELSSSLLASPDGNPENSLAARILLSAYNRDPSASSKAIRLSFMAASLAGEQAFPPSSQVFSNPAWVQFVLHNPSGTIRTAVTGFFPNDQHAAMFVVLHGPLSINAEARAAKGVLAIVNSAHFENATTMTTGVPALLESINNYLKGGMLTLGAIAGAIMALVLLVFFTVRWRLLPFVIVAVGLAWGFGLVGYFGIPLSLGSIAGLPTLLGIGIDYAIQMHSRIEEEVVLDRSAHPIQAAARSLGPALLVVTVDAVLAFVALWFSRVPMIRQFGELLVIGIIAVCIFSIVGPLAFLGIREYRSPTRGKDFSTGRMARMVVWLGSLPPKSAVPLALASLVIFTGGLAVEGRIHLQTDPIQWINPNSTAGRQINDLRKETGANNELGVMVTTPNPFSNETVDFVAHLGREQLSRYPGAVFPALGIVNVVDQLTEIPGTTFVPATGSEVAAVYALAPPNVRRAMVGEGGHALNLIFRAKTPTITGLTPMVHALEHSTATPAGIHVMPGGIAVVGVGLLDNLASSRTLLTYLALLFVGVWLAIRLRSITRSLLSLVPVLIAVGSVALIAYGLNLQLSPMTAVSGPLVVAACTEFTSLILLRFVEERGRGLGPREAVDVAGRRTGRAFMVSAMTAVVGIGVMATSSMPLLRGFGTMVALNVAVALAAALVILPPLLVWAERWDLVSRGLVRTDDLPREVVYAGAPGLEPSGAWASVGSQGNGSALQHHVPAYGESGTPPPPPVPPLEAPPPRTYGPSRGSGPRPPVSGWGNPGWHPDPFAPGAGQLRYWDGTSWTGQVRAAES